MAWAIAGCGPTGVVGPEKHPVSGTVTLDGKPLSFGTIFFVDADDDPPRRYIAEIVDGTFEANSTPGKKKVEIRATQPTTTTGGGNPAEAAPELIPARYNAQTTLEAEISATGTNEFAFDLTSAAK